MIPCVDDTVEILLITQPTALIDMMTYGTGYEIVFVRIVAVDEKLGHAISYRSVLDMLA